MKTTQSRRQFIQSVVGTAGACKLVTLMPHAAFAAGEAPKRLLCVFHPMGYLDNSFWPTGDGADFTLGETQQALNPHKSKLLYVDGLLNSGRAYWEPRWGALGLETDNEHGSGMCGVFTGSWIDKSHGYAASASIDQAVANAVYAKTPTPFKSIALALGAANGSHGNAFYVGAGNPAKPMTSPNQAYDTLFAKLQVQAPGAMPDNSAFLKSKMEKQRVIDNARAEFKAVCARIGSAEKAMCDAHLEGINQLESRLKSLSPVSSAGCSKPSVPGALSDPQASIRAQMDVIKSAFSCDLSRVATLQIGGADGGIDVAGFANQHATTHATGPGASSGVLSDHKKWDAWWASQWSYLLTQLDSVKEGNGTLLDNTLIVFGSDTTTGQSIPEDQGAHNFYRFPLWLAGGSNFAFKTGRRVKLATPPPATRVNAKWRYHNSLLVSVGRAFGLDMNTFGTWDQGKGPIAELT